jgi:hypothetical protein
MKITDHTPFFKDGKISPMDKVKASMKYGAAWFQEIEAQNVVIEYLEKALGKTTGYHLLRNITLQGLEVEIPFILLGPTGIYVMHATALRGMYRAKNEDWGTIEANSFKPAKANLLARTARLGKALQIYLQRQGFSDLPLVEALLLCSDPGMHVDTIRPVIRVVQRDALDRLAISITLARPVLSYERVQDVYNRILTPRPPQPKPSETLMPTPEPAAGPENESYVPTFALPPEEQPPQASALSAEGLGFDFQEQAVSAPQESPSGATDVFSMKEEPAAATGKPRPGKMKRNQVILLAVMGTIECLILVCLVYILFR